MDAALAVTRAIHFGATMLVFGELVFVVLVAGPRWRAAMSSANARDTLDRHVFAFVAWALAIAAVSGLAWLVIEATQMSGATIAQVLAEGTVSVVLRETEFGHVFVLRGLLWLALVASLVSMHRGRGNVPRAAAALALVLAGAFVAMLADAGHAAAASGGTIRVLHLGADAAHLVAAAAWLGALPPLVQCLAHAPPGEALARLATRFSALGIGCVAVLLASGIVNTLFLVGSFAALFGTAYGQLLDVKLALFAVMLGLAATNRSRLAPRLVDMDNARRALARNASLEIMTGVAIVAIVGALGTMVPGAHQSPRWPFAFALDLAPDELTAGSRALLVAGVVVAVVSFGIIIVGMRRKAMKWSIAGGVTLLGSLAASTSLFAVPAFPTTYTTSPVPYTVDVVARGMGRFAQDCSSCHGADARGDGPAAATLSMKPMNLAEHALHHPEGNLFWWIAHGIPDTPMPAFSPRLSDNEIWEIVQFLVARSSAEAAMSMGTRVDAQSMSRVPDFTYDPQQQLSLASERKPALLVLYSTPASDARLSQLAADARLAHANVRVIPIPIENGSADNSHGAAGNLAAVYRMFAGKDSAKPANHVELLVDGAGILRARWTGIPPASSNRDAEIAAAVHALPSAESAPAPMHHGHH